jgi:hypothetical protein
MQALRLLPIQSQLKRNLSEWPSAGRRGRRPARSRRNGRTAARPPGSVSAPLGKKQAAVVGPQLVVDKPSRRRKRVASPCDTG